MDELLKQLNIKRKELQAIIKYAEDYLVIAPEGSLRMSPSHNSVQFFWKKQQNDLQNAKGIYISKKNKPLIFGLAQKDYAQKLLHKAKEELKCIQQLIDKYEPNGIESIYDNLSTKRQEIVKPYILPINQFVDQWMDIKYEEKKNNEEQKKLETERGDRVRSKSEKILADKLYLMQVPYHYEKPLYINGYGNIYPDFTVLNKRTRKVYYWEHLGLMDQADYCENVIKKIEGLQNSGIFLGERLILTFETSKHPINTKIVEGLIRKYLL